MNNMEYFKGKKLIVSFLQIINYFELWILTLVCLKPSIPQRKHILNTNNNLNLKWETIHKTSNITNYELFVEFANNNLNLKWETIHKTSNITNYELFVEFVFENLQNIINSMYWSKIWRWEFSFVGDLVKNFGNTNMELLQNVIS